MFTKKLKIGLFGAGDISIIHGEAIKENKDAELIGIWNRTESRGKERANQFNCKFYKEPLDLVNDPEIDAVFVLTNIETHLELSKLAISKGKHVLVEKPVGMTVNEIRKIKRYAESAGIVCMPGHNNIYEDGILRMKKMIDSGEIGKTVSLNVLYNIYHSEEIAERYPGVIRQILTHNLYCMIYLSGKPKQVMAIKSRLHYKNLQREDIAMIIMKLENDGLAYLNVSFAADDLSSDPWTFLIKVIGTEGSARYSYQDWVLAKKGLAHSRVYLGYKGSIANEVNHFINICLNGGLPLSTLDDAINSQIIMEAVEKSIEKNVGVNLKLI